MIFHHTNLEFYQKKISEFKKEFEELSIQNRDGFAPPYRMAISNAGKLFIRLALDNYYSENITASSLSDFLNIRLKHMKKIEQEIMGHSISFGDVS